MKTLVGCPLPYNFKKSPYKQVLYGEQEVPVNAPVLLHVTIFSTNQDRNLALLGDLGRVRSQITSVVCLIQRSDFDCNLVVTRTLIIYTPPLYVQNLYIFTV